jgi:hypothetical protein
LCHLVLIRGSIASLFRFRHPHSKARGREPKGTFRALGAAKGTFTALGKSPPDTLEQPAVVGQIPGVRTAVDDTFRPPRLRPNVMPPLTRVGVS